MLKQFVADLHVHTVLSPCANYRMVPELLVERALEVGVNLLGITDHNSGENVAAVVSAAQDSGVTVLPGMEVESREGVHLLTLFDDVEGLERWQGIVYEALPRRENVDRVFGSQLVVDAAGHLLRVNQRLLITAADLSLEEVIATSLGLGGLCIPAHVDRPANGLLPVLGLLPGGFKTVAVEISWRLTPQEAVRQFPALAGHTLLRSSDAHYLEDIGKATTTFLVTAASVAEIALACRQEQGRRAIV